MSTHFLPPEPPSRSEPRVIVTLVGRYMLRREGEFPCHTFEMSPDEVSLFAPVRPTPGEEVILYLNALGRFPGVATKHTEAGFEMALKLSAKKRERLAEQLKWFANRQIEDVPDRRRYDRVVPLNPITIIRLPWGTERVAKIRSVSLSGVSIEAEIWPAINSTVVVGSRPATVVRHSEDGFACEFQEHLNEGELDETVRL